jgi:hypothetical protein
MTLRTDTERRFRFSVPAEQHGTRSGQQALELVEGFLRLQRSESAAAPGCSRLLKAELAELTLPVDEGFATGFTMTLGEMLARRDRPQLAALASKLRVLAGGPFPSASDDHAGFQSPPGQRAFFSACAQVCELAERWPSRAWEPSRERSARLEGLLRPGADERGIAHDELADLAVECALGMDEQTLPALTDALYWLLARADRSEPRDDAAGERYGRLLALSMLCADAQRRLPRPVPEPPVKVSALEAAGERLRSALAREGVVTDLHVTSGVGMRVSGGCDVPDAYVTADEARGTLQVTYTQARVEGALARIGTSTLWSGESRYLGYPLRKKAADPADLFG